jgi:hypothetical protein
MKEVIQTEAYSEKDHLLVTMMNSASNQKHE